MQRTFLLGRSSYTYVSISSVVWGWLLLSWVSLDTIAGFPLSLSIIYPRIFLSPHEPWISWSWQIPTYFNSTLIAYLTAKDARIWALLGRRPGNGSQPQNVACRNGVLGKILPLVQFRKQSNRFSESLFRQFGFGGPKIRTNFYPIQRSWWVAVVVCSTWILKSINWWLTQAGNLLGISLFEREQRGRISQWLSKANISISIKIRCKIIWPIRLGECLWLISQNIYLTVVGNEVAIGCELFTWIAGNSKVVRVIKKNKRILLKSSPLLSWLSISFHLLVSAYF